MPDIQTVMNEALNSHTSGRLDDAERLYKQVLSIDPQISDAVHLLGVIALARGDARKAAKTIRRAIKMRGDYPAYYGNLALTYLSLNKFKEAAKAANKAVRLDPGDSGFHCSLGSAMDGLGKLPEAEQAYCRALEIDPTNGAALNNLGTICMRGGDFDRSVDLFTRYLSGEPNDPAVLSQRAAAFIELARLEDAERDLETVFRVAPDSIIGLKTRAKLNIAREQWAAARADLETVIPSEPDDAQTFASLATIASKLDDNALSVALNKKALALDPSSANIYCNLGIALSEMGDLDGAETSLRAALDLQPGHISAIFSLGTGRGLLDGDILAQAEKLAASGDLDDEQRTKLKFALAHQYQKRSDYGRAFQMAVAANALRKRKLENDNKGFSPDYHRDFLERIKTVFSGQFFAGRKSNLDPPAQPIFILGMPRSGTTLVEQIMAGHSAIETAGELDLIEDLSRSMPDFPGAVANLPEQTIAQLAKTYLAGTGERRPNASQVIDKMPFNFIFLGFIHLLFPGARVIHCRRNLRDTGVSCFFQRFEKPHAWSTDLAHLGLYLKSYEALMDHWKQVLPDAMLEVDYEKLVSNPETVGRQIMGYVGIDWDPKSLQFHERRSNVTTASKWQVREPVYTRSIDRWRQFESQLKPMIDAMD
ncbi:MAG: tetratricopeptide repeat protein [Rhodospirillaceae bacterium]|jgi:Flp pilus assembly protein TadD|nr:tetratricopeptide repeat protein [Rhodospirillaceae bacterium]MBT3886136.1 tetratricopeptide repeat protein [Rhodospirillaceae bacterium]MBT4118207.1 tetratricopeptide repeat protein [Rhodospirillaceae bacterium]MBT4673050.1 tetratricopeptide repeat protein [Rhodospirillaceae bacterium]MBT4721009.1 tetratricopeptide repeat protein [Rhodospirillaceae bacterium]